MGPREAISFGLAAPGRAAAAAALALGLLLGWGVLQARAQPGGTEPAALGEQARKGIECYDALNFGCARQSLQAALPKEAVRENQVLVRQYLAYTLVALGDEDGAAVQFLEIFRLDGTYSLSPKKVSPKIFRVYRIALRRYEAEKAEHEATILA